MEAREFYSHLIKDLIPFWNRMRDEENGGFYGWADAEGNPDGNTEKGVLLTSRILWFYSAAFLFLKDRELKDAFFSKAELLRNAEHAYRFFQTYCVDRAYGGVYWTVKADGSPADTTKYTYNMAFAIYALSAYYEAGGSKEALETALSLYERIETICRGEKGYLEAFDRVFRPVVNEELSENGVTAERTMNTLLHAMESFTELYRVSRSEEVAASLAEILEAFRTIVYNPEKKSCEVFFDEDFHSLIDLESYGHNIETSWLIGRACEVLKDENVTEKMRPVIEGLAEGAYRNGINRKEGGLDFECDRGNRNSTRSWWPQAEAVIGFYNQYQLLGDKEVSPSASDYLEAAEQIWSFIKDHVIDAEQGEWIENIAPGNEVKEGQPLVHLWKCPYHTGRMCMEMVNRMEG